VSDTWAGFLSVWGQITALLNPLDPVGDVLAVFLVGTLGFVLLRMLLRLVW
jgi:hypothetical protein